MRLGLRAHAKYETWRQRKDAEWYYEPTENTAKSENNTLCTTTNLEVLKSCISYPGSGEPVIGEASLLLKLIVFWPLTLGPAGSNLQLSF